jgi:hypothetical protein
MSAPQKPYGGSSSKAPLSRLKNDTSALEREWAFGLRSAKNPATGEIYTNTECRGEIHEKLGISLGSDSAYTDFCQWYFRNRQWDVLGDIAEQDEATLKDRFPQLSRDQIRDAVIKRQYAVAELMNDPKHTLKVIKVDQAESTGRTRAEFEKEKLELAKLAEERQREALRLEIEKHELASAEKMLDKALQQRANEINASNLSQAEKIAAMRQAAFKDVEALQASGKLQIPKA